MKFVKSYLYRDGQPLVNPFTGAKTRASGQTIDVWQWTGAAHGFYKGSRPTLPHLEPANPHQLASMGHTVRVNVYAPS